MKIVCKKDVIMEGGDDKGNTAFTKGKEYVVWFAMFSKSLRVSAIDNFGRPHQLLETSVHNADADFIEEHFDLSSLKTTTRGEGGAEREICLKAAEAIAGKDWHKISINMQELALMLEKYGYLIKSTSGGFVGKAAHKAK